MLYIKFEYMDRYTNGKWNVQECYVDSIKTCMNIYGLGIDCEYHILEVREVTR